MFHFYLGESIPNIVDYLTLFVSFVTGGLLYFTFKEQIKINKAALSKHRREIRPYFICKFSPDHGDHYLSLTNANAFQVLIISKEGNLCNDEGKPMPLWDLSYSPVEVTYSLNKDSTTHELIWTINFHDEDGRKYQQKLFCDDFGGSVYTIPPKLLKDV